MMKDDQLSFSLCPGHCSTDMGLLGAKDLNKKPDHSAEDGAKHIMYITMVIPFIANPKWNGSFFDYNDKQPSDF